MKKNILSLLLPFCLMFSAVQAQETNCYAKIFGGANFLQNTKIQGNNTNYHTGYIVSGSLGYYLCYGLRFEGEYAYRRNAIKKIDFITQGSSHHGHFQASSYMGNLIWELPLSSWDCIFCNIQPFFGAGLGYDFQQMSSSNSLIRFHQKWHHFSWQLMTGLSYPIFCNTELSLEYRFHQGGCHFYNHAIGVGLLYKFGFSNKI